MPQFADENEATRANGTQSHSEHNRGRSALVLYGSETGNAQDVAEEIGRLTERLRFDTVVLDLDSVDIRDLLRYTVTIVAISTTGQGDFPQNARSFWRALLSSRLRPGVLRRVTFTTFGLGDSSYVKFNVAHRMLHGRLVQLGARSFCARAEGNEQHPEGHSAEFRAWILELRSSLETSFRLPPGLSAISETEFIEPGWKLELATSVDNGEGPRGLTTRLESLSLGASPDDSLIPIRGSIVANIASNDRLTPEAHFQDVRLLDLRLNEVHEYGPGAVAVVYPKNFPSDVEEFIKCQGWDRIADRLVELVPTVSTSSVRSPSPLAHVDMGTTTLRQLLTNHLDILSIPRRSFFSNLAYFTRSETEDEQFHRERILELANPELIDELWDYTTRPRRTILEVMSDFPTVKIPWQYACTVLPIMRGRQFSIASGGDLRRSGPNAGKVQLLVAIANPPNPIIKYRRRYGVCTRYIAQLQAGRQINIGLQPGYLDVKQDDYDVPMIMISPGTGVAPMRCLIYARLEQARSAKEHQARQPGKLGKPLDNCLLFYGCRDRSADFFFEGEWTSLESEGLRTFLATSRSKDAPRQYVQDLLREQASVVFDAIFRRQGRIFVCGSSGNMPKGVRQALIEIIMQEDQRDAAAAESFLEGLEKSGRYKQETW